MTDLYSFRSAPSYSPLTKERFFNDAMDTPLSVASTFFDQAKGGVLESFGLGTQIKNMTIPEGEQSAGDTGLSLLNLANPLTAPFESSRLAAQAFIEQGKPLTEGEYKSSAWFRDSIPWDQGMTTTRAAALATMDDARKVREFYAQKRPIMSFLGNLSGQALDPINYVPVGGELVKAAAVARFGTIGGAMLHSSVDAAANTGIFSVATSGDRSRYGDDVSWQATVSQMATAALIGSAFGAIGGAVEARSSARDGVRLSRERAIAEDRLATLQTTQEARVALNEAIDGVVRGEDVRLTPNATEPLSRVANDLNPARSPNLFAPLERTDLYGTTAIGRIVDTRPVQLQDFETAIRRDVLSSNPDLASRYQAAEAKFNAAQEKVSSIEGPLNARTAADAAALIDPASAERLKAIESDLSNNPSKAKAAALQNERDMIVQSIGPDALAKAENDFRVGPQKQAKQARKALASARQEFSKVRRETDQIAAKHATVQRVRNAVSIDNSAPRPDPIPEGRQQAESRIAKPDDAKALAVQHSVDPQTGDFPEMADIEHLKAEGRLTEEDAATMEQAKADYETASAYAEALKSVTGCLV